MRGTDEISKKREIWDKCLQQEQEANEMRIARLRDEGKPVELPAPPSAHSMSESFCAAPAGSNPEPVAMDVEAQVDVTVSPGNETVVPASADMCGAERKNKKIINEVECSGACAPSMAEHNGHMESLIGSGPEPSGPVDRKSSIYQSEVDLEEAAERDSCKTMRLALRKTKKINRQLRKELVMLQETLQAERAARSKEKDELLKRCADLEKQAGETRGAKNNAHNAPQVKAPARPTAVPVSAQTLGPKGSFIRSQLVTKPAVKPAPRIAEPARKIEPPRKVAQSPATARQTAPKKGRRRSQKLTLAQCESVVRGELPFELAEYKLLYFRGVKSNRPTLIKAVLSSGGISTRMISSVGFMEDGLLEIAANSKVCERVVAHMSSLQGVVWQESLSPVVIDDREQAAKDLGALKKRTEWMASEGNHNLPARRLGRFIARLTMENVYQGLGKILYQRQGPVAETGQGA